MYGPPRLSHEELGGINSTPETEKEILERLVKQVVRLEEKVAWLESDLESFTPTG